MSDPLYETDRIKITYLHSLEPGKENEISSGKDHELWLKEKDGEWNRYMLPRGVLRELARTVSDNDVFGLISKLDNFNTSIYTDFARKKIFLGDVAQAFLKAYQKEEEEVEKYFSEQKKK
ncbi:MAG TPA: hypothetical protein VMV95_03395 [Bacillota bacterium]|nr:hypothetical protein [Bacillota bacterium]